MGLKDVQFITEPEDQKIAFDFVLSDIKYLNKMIERGDLDRNTQRIGAEQEVCIIDHGLRPAPIIMDFLEGIEDEHFTTELAKFVLEINLDPVELNGSCFSKLEEQIKSYFKQTRSRLNKMGKYDIFLSGILPT
ncbi:MAG: hypothetical protein R3345_16035, partial [Fulvivirga sp.]|nr:hypothetical protein [Fulvivirga sp.]